jgi:hypothetical protein
VFQHTQTAVSKFPQQSRHPERSASQIYCKPRALRRGVEGPRRCLSCRSCSELFDHPAQGVPQGRLSLRLVQIEGHGSSRAVIGLPMTALAAVALFDAYEAKSSARSRIRRRRLERRTSGGKRVCVRTEIYVFSPVGRADLSPGRSPGKTFETRQVSKGRLKIVQGQVAAYFQPSPFGKLRASSAGLDFVIRLAKQKSRRRLISETCIDRSRNPQNPFIFKRTSRDLHADR